MYNKNGENIMKERIEVRLSPEEYRKLKTIASAFRATANEQIRKLINDDYQRNGEAYEEHLSNRIEQGEKG